VARLVGALAAVVLVSLLLPWPGEAGLWFRLAMAVLALNALLLARNGIAAGVLGCAMLLLTSLLLRHGVDWGAYVALAAEAGLIAVGVVSAIAEHRRRTGAEG
jgi:hypothetical protein